MNSDDARAVEDLHRGGGQAHGEPTAGVASRYRVEGLPDTDPRLGVDSGPQQPGGIEGLAGKPPQQGRLGREGGRDRTGPAGDHPLVVADVCALDQFIEFGQRLDAGQGHEMPATEPADLTFHTTFLMGSAFARAAKETVESVFPELDLVWVRSSSSRRRGYFCGQFVLAGVAGMPWLTRVGRRSSWASLSWAPARETRSPSTSPSQPSRCASVMRARRLSRISSRRGRWVGSGHRSEHLTQACSWMHGVPIARAQVPTETLRRCQWPRNSSHSSSVGVRYSSLGRRARRRARNARWAWIASSG